MSCLLLWQVRKFYFKNSKSILEAGNTRFKRASHSKKEKKPSGETNIFVDDFDKCIIQNTVYDLYGYEKVIPTAEKLADSEKKNTFSVGSEVTYSYYT